MIDLHCHLAYGVDDGPHNEEESLDLARALVDAGVTTVACTSHLRRDKNWVNDIHVQKSIHGNLDQLLNDKGVKLTRHTGAEHYIDELIVATCEKKEVVTYGAENNWLLIELPYQGMPPDMFGTLNRIRRAGYNLLLAHLERFPYVVEHPELVERMVDSGYAIQINLGSLAGAYHRKHKKYARWLLENDFVHVAAGDCHRWKDVKKCVIKGLYKLERLAGEDAVHRLTVTNPQKILNNKVFDALE